MMDGASGPLEVVAGVLTDRAGRVLVAERPPGRSRAGAWEFPGGKREPGEVPRDALVRELAEELGVEVKVASRLLVVCHRYPDAPRPVRLDVWRVTLWGGEPRSLDGQALRWCRPEALSELDLLEADRPLVTMLTLPALFVHERDPARLLARVRARRGQPGPRIAWVSGGEVSTELLGAVEAVGDRLCVCDPPAPPGPGVLPIYSPRGFALCADRGGGQAGALVTSPAQARAARDSGAQFLLVRDAGLPAAELERIGETGLPYYPNVARPGPSTPRPRAPTEPKPVASGQLWWREG